MSLLLTQSGNSITQYTEGNTDPTITGVAVMWEDSSDTLRPVSAAKPLPVDIQNVTLEGDVNIVGDYVDDSAFTVGSDRALAVGGVFSTDTIDSGDFGAFAIDASRRQLVSLEVDNIGLATSANQATLVTRTKDKNTFFNEFEETGSISGSSETTVLTYTVPAGKTARIQGFNVTGTACARFRLKVDGTTSAVARTSTADRTVVLDFRDGYITAAENLDITITAFHEEATNQTTECNLFGYLV